MRDIDSNAVLREPAAATAGAWPANQIIRASAGSGKTYQLCLRYLELLCREAASHGILAMTFTRKAAAEILDRVAKLLAAAAQSPSVAAEVARQIGDPEFETARATQLLRRLVSNLHRLQIGTLDSFFSRVSRTNSLQMGLHPHWEIGEAAALDEIRRAAIRRVLAQDNTLDLLRLMAKGDVHRNVSDMMLDAVERLYEIYLDSQPGAWSPFPEVRAPAAAKLEEILQAIESIPLADAAARVRDSDVAKARAEDWDQLVKTGYFAKVAAGETTYSGKPIPPDLLAAYAGLVDYVRATLVSQVHQATQATYQLLRAFDGHFAALKHRAGLFEFADVTRWLEASGTSWSDAEWMSRRLDLPVEHLLLDEFQDTSPLQWRIVQPIAHHVACPGAPRTFFCVGDMKQAIYGWRGGVAEVFDLVESQLPGLEPRDLTTSYRSSPIVIETVNRVFENLADYRSKDSDTNDVVRRWGERFRHHTTARNSSGYCELRAVEGCDEDEPLVDFLVETIRPVLAADPNLSVGILTYSNAEIPPIIAGLQRAGLAASEEGGTPLDDSASVNVILSLLQLADHPDDTSCWFHLAGSPLGGLLGIPEFTTDHPRNQAPVAVHQFAAAIRRALSEHGYGAMLGRWAQLAVPHCTEHELRRLQKLVELADEYDGRSTSRASDFIRQVQATKVEDPSSAGIRVMTIHKSKGLEFDVVFVPRLKRALAGQTEEVILLRPAPTEPVSLVCRRVGGAVRQLLPPEFEVAYRQQRGRQISESLCVLYVAMTRARRALYLLVSPKRSANHQTPAGILLATLGSAAPPAENGILYAHGDPNWIQAAPPAQEQAPAPMPRPDPAFYLAAAPAAGPLRLATSPRAERPAPGLAPSRREGSAERNAARIFTRPLASPALTRGALLHAMLAQIQWLDGPDAWSERKLEQLRPRCRDPKLWRSAITQLHQIVQQPQLATLLNRGSYLARAAERLPAGSLAFDSLSATVETERAFATREENGAIVTGAIDRCVQIYAGGQLHSIEVIDFKTDAIAQGPAIDPVTTPRSPLAGSRRAADRVGLSEADAASRPGGVDAADLAAHVEFYRPQLAAYRRAAARVFGLPLDRVWATLVFTAIDLAVDVR